MTEALVDQVLRRSNKISMPHALRIPIDLPAFTCTLVRPMVTGLFGRSEVSAVMDLLKQSIHFVTHSTVVDLLRSESLGTAWDIANLFLLSIGQSPLSDSAPQIVGLSCETRCYVSTNYFDEENTFADFVVHEAAHVFHNVQRRTVGLHSTRKKEWLLPINYRMRETFAYACETYSRILVLSKSPKERKHRFDQLQSSFDPPDDRVDRAEYFDIVEAAIGRRNGWQVILENCS